MIDGSFDVITLAMPFGKPPWNALTGRTTVSTGLEDNTASTRTRRLPTPLRTRTKAAEAPLAFSAANE